MVCPQSRKVHCTPDSTENHREPAEHLPGIDLLPYLALLVVFENRQNKNKNKKNKAYIDSPISY